MARRALLVFAEAHAAPEAVWSVQAAGFDVVLCARRGVRTPARRLPGLRVVEVAAPEEDAEATVAELERAARRIGPAATLALDDAAVWVLQRAELPGAVVPGRGQAALALRKDRQFDLARAAGFPVPPTLVLRPGDPTPPLDGPHVAKGAAAAEVRDGRLTRWGTSWCASTADLERLRGGARTPELLVQPRISGRGEGLFGLATPDGRVVALSAHRRVRMANPRGSGSSACAAAPVAGDLADATQAFVTASGWRGPFMLELLRDTGGVPWFMELNGRMWGSFALARRQGLEYAGWALQQAVGETPAGVDAARSGAPVVARHAGREVVHLLHVLRGRPAGYDGAWPERMSTLRDILRVRPTDRWYNLGEAGRAWFALDAATTVLDAVRGARS